MSLFIYIVILIILHVFVTDHDVAASTGGAAESWCLPVGNAHLLLGKKNTLCMYNIHWVGTSDCIPEDSSGVQVLDFHYTQSYIFYKSNGRGIKRKKLPLSNSTEEDLSVKSYKDVVSAAVDWVHNNLFLNYGDKVEKTDLEGQNAIPVVSTQVIGRVVSKPPHAVLNLINVQVDPYQQAIFIQSTYVLSGKETVSITRSDTDGGNLKLIYNRETSSLATFSIDVEHRTLYVKVMNKLHTYNYDGTAVEPQMYALELFREFKSSEQFHVALNSFYGLVKPPGKTKNVLLSKAYLIPSLADSTQPKLSKLSSELVTSLKVYNHRLQQDPSKVCDSNCADWGRRSPIPLWNIAGGDQPNQGQFPWHAIIYKRDPDGTWNPSCGGTLITLKVILTVAYCVTIPTTDIPCLPVKMNVEHLRIALGKDYRDYNRIEDFEQRPEVKDIIPHTSYGGDIYKYEHNVALLILGQCVKMTYFVKPALIDFNLDYLWKDPINNEALEGEFPGTGVITDCLGGHHCMKYSDTVRFYRASIISNKECLKKTKNAVELAPDHFCVGNKEGSPIQKGDEGGGMTFEFDGKSYVYGVIGYRIAKKGKEIESIYGTVIDVSAQLPWLKQYLS